MATCTPRQLQERLIDFSAGVCDEIRRLPQDIVGNHVAKQLVRCATSPAANYAEARGADSRRDFVHKMQVCLKELRETSVWLQLAQRIAHRKERLSTLTIECGELTAIFVTSIKTARSSDHRRTPTQPNLQSQDFQSQDLQLD